MLGSFGFHRSGFTGEYRNNVDFAGFSNDKQGQSVPVQDTLKDVQ